MKKNIIAITILVITCLTFTGAVYASDTEILFNRLDILINGKEAKVDNIIYNNTVYVPLLKIAELFNKDVQGSNELGTYLLKDRIPKASDGFYTQCDKFRTAFISNVDNNKLNLEFELKNITNENVTVTFDDPNDFVIYDENNVLVYRYKRDSLQLFVGWDETIQSGDKLVDKFEIDLTDKRFVSGQTYKVVFYKTFEMGSEKYRLTETTYFKITE